jgi:hypothetical protein
VEISQISHGWIALQTPQNEVVWRVTTNESIELNWPKRCGLIGQALRPFDPMIDQPLM